MKKFFAVTLAAALLTGMTSFLSAGAQTAPAAATGGFVTANGNYFMLDGKPFYYQGANNYYMNYGTNDMIDDVLSDAAAMDLKVLRCWGFLDGTASAGYVMQPSLGVYDDSGFERLDYTISEAERLGIKLILPMINNWNDFGGMNQYVSWAGASAHDDFYTNAVCKTGYKNYVNHLLNHVNTYTGVAYKNDPTIMAFELANEPRCQSDPSCNTLVSWADEMSTYVKSIDSNHLVTVGDEGFFNRGGSDYCYNGGSGVDWDRLIALPNIDFETMHLYPDGWGKTIDWSVQYINDHIDTAKEVGKPVILEEYGTTSDKLQNYTRFNDAVYQSSELGEGAAGSMFWLLTGVGWNGIYPDYDGFRVTYPSDVASLISGYAAQMDEKSQALPGNSSSITPQSAAFDLYVPAAIPVTLGLNGNTFTGIDNGGTPLTAGSDYTISGSTVTLSAAYLSRQPEGMLKLKFLFSAGSPQVLTVNITDSTPVVSATISPTSASFDRNPAHIADIPVTVTANGQTLQGIYNGGTPLTAGSDYTVTGSTVTISRNYLTGQPVGPVNLKFDFAKGSDPVLTVTVADTSPVPQGGLSVKMFNASTQPSSNGIAPRFLLTNTTASAISLSAVRLRYYFTEDAALPQNFWCDWSSIGSSNVTGSFVTLATPASGADTYLEIGFTAGAGSLAPGASVEIQTRFAKNDWSSYNQADDYSFNPTANSYVTWTKVTAFLSGNLLWGAEP